MIRAHLQKPYNRRRPTSYKKEFLDRYIPNKTFYLAEADIPEADREEVVNFIENEYQGLHEGDVILYRLGPEDLAGIRSEVYVKGLYLKNAMRLKKTLKHIDIKTPFTRGGFL